MKLRWAIFAIGTMLQLAVASHVRGDIGTVETTGAFAVNTGTTNAYISTVGAGQNPRWAGYSFGTFDVSAGNTLTLTNFYFENYAFNGGSIPPGGSFNDNWLDGTNTATFKLFRDGNEIYQTFMRQSGASGNNRFWDLAAAGVSVNALAGLTSGAHTLSYTIDWTYNQWTGSQVITGTTQNTSSGVATFAVVPEPSSLAALAAGGLVSAGLWIKRRRAA